MLEKIASESKTTSDVVKDVLNAYNKFVFDALKENKDERVPLPGIGNFTVKHVSERKGISALGEKKAWVKPAHDELVFKVSPSVKQFD